MATKVFISWGGDLSRRLAEALRNWLPAALQYVKPYFSPDDIEKGAKWNSEIAKELESSNVGVVCLTSDNTEKPWILFEAGALSKSLDRARVCTLLFGLEPAELKGPLTSFQATKFVRDDFKKLVSTINSCAGDARLDGSVLDSVFDMWWPRLEAQVTEIMNTREVEATGTRRTERDILEEVLALTRMNASRAHRPSRIGSRTLAELWESLHGLIFLATHEGGDACWDAARDVQMHLRRLCMQAGVPEEAYERYRMGMSGHANPPGEAEPGVIESIKEFPLRHQEGER